VRSQHVAARAAVTAIGAVACFAVLDAMGKLLVARYPAELLVWVRYVVQTFTLLLLLGPRMGRSLVATRALPLQLVRGALMATSSVMMVIAFSAMPLADATAINFAAPSIVMVLAFLFLHERVTPVRLASVMAGLVGVLLIVRPGTSVFQPIALLPLGTALAAATYQVITRKLADEDARTMLFYASVVGAIAFTAFMPWRGLTELPPWTDCLQFVLLGWLAAAGHFLFIRAFQQAPASGLASITYVQLVFATLFGLAIFGDFPDGWTLLGMAIITVSGLFLTLYERRRHIVRDAEPPAVD